MSGLCAIVSFDGSTVRPEDARSMADAARYRGRDGDSIWSGPGAVLAYQATWVGSPNEVAAQPVSRAGLTLVADARIDNRTELVATLAARGYLAGDAATTPDSDVILAAHRCWGDTAPAHLIGDFAYVLWDERRRRLLAARDPMGMRPLSVRIEPGRRTIVASEISQILAAPDIPRAIDERWIVATLAGPYMPNDATVYTGIDHVAPGGILIVDPDGVMTRRYWTPDPSARLAVDEEEAASLFREGLTEAVADRLRTDRPVGLMLSGGMDSGSVASIAGWLAREGRLVGGPPRMYSWAFPTMPDADERSISGSIATAFDLPVVPVDGDDAWPLSDFPDGGPDADEPLSWPYQGLMERTAARAAADGVRILLTADRGDELVGDWVHDELGLLRAGRIRTAAAELRTAAREDGRSIMTSLRRYVVRSWLWEHAPGMEARLSRRRDRPRWAPWIPDAAARRVDLGDLIADATRLPRWGDHARSLRYQRLFLPQAARLAAIGERIRARAGLGFADPMADRRLVELVLALPQWQVQLRSRPKRLAREALRGIMPDTAARAVAKTIPVSLYDRGLRERAVTTARTLLTTSRAARNGWIDGDAALAAYEEYVATGRTRFDVWWPLTVEWWLRRWWS